MCKGFLEEVGNAGQGGFPAESQEEKLDLLSGTSTVTCLLYWKRQ